MYQKISLWFLAISMFLFGVLKFINPFQEWYSLQISNSGLPTQAYPLGIFGEISVGILLIFCLMYNETISKKTFFILTNLSLIIIILMMLTGVFVHLHPNVPAELLPLKIKPPYIPIFFLLLSLSNIYLSIKQPKNK